MTGHVPAPDGASGRSGMTVTLHVVLDEAPNAELWRAVVATAESLRDLAVDALPSSRAEVVVAAS